MRMLMMLKTKIQYQKKLKKANKKQKKNLKKKILTKNKILIKLIKSKKRKFLNKKKSHHQVGLLKFQKEDQKAILIINYFPNNEVEKIDYKFD